MYTHIIGDEKPGDGVTNFLLHAMSDSVPFPLNAIRQVVVDWDEDGEEHCYIPKDAVFSGPVTEIVSMPWKPLWWDSDDEGYSWEEASGQK